MVIDTLKKFGDILISEVMIHDPLYFTTPEEKISATELLMLRKKIGGLPVVNNPKNKQLIGIITQRDIRLARFAVSLETPKTTIRDLMTPEPIVIKKDNTIRDALNNFFKYNIERLPVVTDHDNELIGLVIQNDILRRLHAELSKQV
ncbi:MAG: CBS domain-containing protein [Candidatus Lokiarchaeota archaeon]|nr:CBS domain-containing protein [Candidatus Lokiarchaeota archaeon]